MLILIVDDDESIARVIGSYLRQSGYEVVAVHDSTSALETIQRRTIDLMILDIMLPDGDGWRIVDKVRRDSKLSHLPIMILSAKIEDADKIYGLQLGADDYVAKPFNPQLVVAKVQRMLQRFYPNRISNVLRIGELEVNTDNRECRLAGDVIPLTPTEFAILKTMMENSGYVFSRAELISRSLGYQYESLERTVDSHIRNLRSKLEADADKPRYIQTVYGVGYSLREED